MFCQFTVFSFINPAAVSFLCNNNNKQLPTYGMLLKFYIFVYVVNGIVLLVYRQK